MRSESMLRSGDFAFYHNQEYELYENGNDTVNLVTNKNQSIEHGFIEDPFSNRFEKTVNIQEVTNAYHIKTYGKYKNVEPFGIHNITIHNGGRSTGMWADAPR
jgi:hypothetical protein